jgi:hypothetical protein
MSEEYFGKSREEFIDFISDMLINDDILANNILDEYFGDQNPQMWDLRTDILVEWYSKKGHKEKWKNLRTIL